MKITLIAAAGAALALTAITSAPAAAQSAQERLDARYDRALAAGYKALMLCSAIANAEANGTKRTVDSIHELELAGIQAPLDKIVQELDYEIVRHENGQFNFVSVTWGQGVEERHAQFAEGRGCVGLPLGSAAPTQIVVEQGHANRSSRDQAKFVGPRLAAKVGEPNSSAELAANLSGPFGAAFEQTYGARSRTTAVLVKRGNAVAEQYVAGFDALTPQRTWSVAKSIASTLIGAAVQRGQADVSASAGLGVNSNDPRRGITIDHALRMASGRYSDTAGNRTDPLYWGGTTVDERAQNWPLLAKPNTVYRYANNDTLAAVKAIEGTFKAHPPAELFAKLEMHHTITETDWQGNYVLSSQAWTTARDLAKLGQLYLNDGVWNGERLLPENWREYVSDPSGPQPEGTDWGYGAGWWTFRRPEGNAFEGIPDDAFAARGNRGQYVVVVPSRNVVIVRRGEDMVGTRFDIAAFTRDVLAQLD